MGSVCGRLLEKAGGISGGAMGHEQAQSNPSELDVALEQTPGDEITKSIWVDVFAFWANVSSVGRRRHINPQSQLPADGFAVVGRDDTLKI